MFRTSWIPTPSQNQSRVYAWMLPETKAGSPVEYPALLKAQADRFTPISLENMDSVALLNRIDIKFTMPMGELLRSLPALQEDYQMLSVCGQRLNHYRTLYFDTHGFDLYRMHVNGVADRYKVRSREYTVSGLSFLEVKHKTRKGRTIKDRIATALPVTEMNLEAETWLEHVYPFNIRDLEPKIWNTYTRITLVSKSYCERVTLDLNLDFFTTGKAAHVDGIVVAEVKRDAEARYSPFLAEMRHHRIRPQGFSKYCLGVSLLFDQVKKNSLKPKMLWIKKMNGGFVFNG